MDIETGLVLWKLTLLSVETAFVYETWRRWYSSLTHTGGISNGTTKKEKTLIGFQGVVPVSKRYRIDISAKIALGKQPPPRNPTSP
jgi:hypothetical protein